VDLESMKSVWEAYIEVQEGKKLSAKQKKHFDKDNDGDIDDDDMAKLNKEETEVVEEGNEPADCVTPAPTRKGDKKNSQASEIKGKAVKEGSMLQDFASMLEAIEEVQGKSKKHPQKDFPLGSSDLDPEASKEHKKHTKGGTDPEGLLDKESKSGEDFVKLHQKSDPDLENKEYEGHDDVSKAGRAVKSQAPARSGGDDIKSGDKPTAPKKTVVAKEEVEQFVDSLDEEQLDELSKNLLTRYKKKADAQTTNHMSKIDQRDPKNPKGPSAASSANFKKRMTGSGRADDKIKGKYAKVPATNANKGKRG